MKKRKSGSLFFYAVAAFLAALILFPPFLFSPSRPMPPGTDIEGIPVPTPPEDIRLLKDETAWDSASGRRIIRQEIFDELLAMIGRADRLVCLDMFLWNPWKGTVPEEHRKLSEELAQALILRKTQVPDLDIIVLTDPINRIYGNSAPEFFEDLSRARIPVIFTDLSRLPESNRVFSPYWSLMEKIFRLPPINGWANAPRLDNPFQMGGPEISLLQFGRMLRFKANHRKVAITGSSRHGLEMLIGSFNPADGSSAHSNMAIQVRGRAVLEVLDSEMEILGWSMQARENEPGEKTDLQGFSAEGMKREAKELIAVTEEKPEWPKVQLLTEGAVGRTIVSLLDSASGDDEVRVALFYLSERGVVDAIKRAAKRGTSFRLILDANRDAFGMRKIGIPNRPVAAELMELSGDHDIKVRWADTHGEQYHLKSFSITNGREGVGILLAGSANWTRRNIGNLNLEANLLIENAPHITEGFNSHFDTMWKNSDGLKHTTPYGQWEEKGFRLVLKNWIYHLQERWGLGTF